MCTLKEKFAIWTEWLVGDDVHSISNQITSMIWDTGIFRCINESRKYAAIDSEGNPELNGEVHGLIDRGYWAIQSIAVRRLLDTSDDVISLIRLVNDIDKHYKLITRQALLDVHGYPYDYEIKKDEIYQARIASKGPKAQYRNDGMLDCVHAEHIHESMDALAGVDKKERQPTDTLNPQIFEFIKQRLHDCDDFRKYVNKFIAHSASPGSRSKTNADELEITLGKIYGAHKILCEVASFIAQEILYRSLGGFLPVPQINQLEYFEKPWIPKDALVKLYEEWEAFDNEEKGWEQWDWKAMYDEFKNRTI